MNDKEKEIVTINFVLREDTYNACIGGEGGPHFKGRSHSKETAEKISQTNLSKKHIFAEYGKKSGSLSKGRKLSEKARRNMSLAAKKRWEKLNLLK
jgi:hypothetical protein